MAGAVNWYEDQRVACWTIRPDLWPLGHQAHLWHRSPDGVRWVAHAVHPGACHFARAHMEREVAAGTGDPGVVEALILAGWQVTHQDWAKLGDCAGKKIDRATLTGAPGSPISNPCPPRPPAPS